MNLSSSISSIQENIGFFHQPPSQYETVYDGKKRNTSFLSILNCSYDTRTTLVPSHWTDTNIMGNRTIFRAGRREPAELIIKQVKVIISFIIITMLFARKRTHIRTNTNYLSVCWTMVISSYSYYESLIWTTHELSLTHSLWMPEAILTQNTSE